MPRTMLKALLREKHLTSYRRFKRAYQEAARKLDKNLADSYPSDATYKRWVTGRVKNLPRDEHCVVLEAIFPGWTAAELLAPYVSPEKADDHLRRRGHTARVDRPAGASDAEPAITNGCAGMSLPSWNPEVRLIKVM